MKRLNIIITIITFFAIAFISCSSENTDEINDSKDSLSQTDTGIKSNDLTIDTVIDNGLKENKKKVELVVSKFICPQGDVKGNTDKPGNCPVCEMELIENPDYKASK